MATRDSSAFSLIVPKLLTVFDPSVKVSPIMIRASVRRDASFRNTLKFGLLGNAYHNFYRTEQENLNNKQSLYYHVE